MIEDLDDLAEHLESLLGGEENNAGEQDNAGGASLEEQRLQLQEELARLTSKLDAVRIQEWVRCIYSYSARGAYKYTKYLKNPTQASLKCFFVSGVHVVRVFLQRGLTAWRPRRN